MSRNPGVTSVSVGAETCVFTRKRALLKNALFSPVYTRNYSDLLVMVPRAGLEPARPLFTKLRILRPAFSFAQRSSFTNTIFKNNICRIDQSWISRRGILRNSAYSTSKTSWGKNG